MMTDDFMTTLEELSAQEVNKRALIAFTSFKRTISIITGNEDDTADDAGAGELNAQDYRPDFMVRVGLEILNRKGILAEIEDLQRQLKVSETALKSAWGMRELHHETHRFNVQDVQTIQDLYFWEDATFEEGVGENVIDPPPLEVIKDPALLIRTIKRSKLNEDASQLGALSWKALNEKCDRVGRAMLDEIMEEAHRLSEMGVITDGTYLNSDFTLSRQEWDCLHTLRDRYEIPPTIRNALAERSPTTLYRKVWSPHIAHVLYEDGPTNIEAVDAVRDRYMSESDRLPY